MSRYNRKLLISEQEKRSILSLYGLIREEDQPVTQETQSSGLKFDKTINFAPGYYKNKKEPITTKSGVYNFDFDVTLKSELEKIKEFLKKNPTGYVVEVNLYSGESQIPNNDNELGGSPVNPGYLTEKRMTSLKEYLNPIFESWKTEGITKTDFKINEKPLPGQTPWVGTPFCPKETKDPRTCSPTYYKKVADKDPVALEYKAKYDAEQKFRVVIEVKKIDTPVATGGTPTVTGKTSTDNVTEDCVSGLEIVVYVKSHGCQNAEYLVYANNTLLTNLVGGNTANLNNSNSKLNASTMNFPAPDGGGSYFVTNADGVGTQAFSTNTDIVAQSLNPAYGYTKNGPYTADENGDPRGQRSDTFKVNSEQSKTITSQGNGKINIWLIGTTKSMHLDIPYVLIKKDGKEVYNGQPKVEQGLVLTLSGCGNEVIDKDSSAQQPTGYEQTLVNIFKERFDKIKSGLGSDAIEKLSKKQMQDVKSITLDRTRQLLELINKVYDIYRNANSNSKTESEYRKLYNSKGNDVERLNLFNQIQLLLDGNPTFRKNEDGTAYLDSNIEGSRKNPQKKLAGDIFLKLEEFYRLYDYFYKNDDQYVSTGLKYDELPSG